MSMEIHIFSDVQLNSTAEWQRAIDQLGQSLRFSSDANLVTARGFFPSTLGGKATGFECYRDDAKSLMANDGRDNFSKPWKYALALRIGADFNELSAAWIAATAYARATNGIVFDGETGRSYSPSQAEQVVRDNARDIPLVEAALKQMEANALAKRRT